MHSIFGDRRSSWSAYLSNCLASFVQPVSLGLSSFLARFTHFPYLSNPLNSLYLWGLQVFPVMWTMNQLCWIIPSHSFPICAICLVCLSCPAHPTHPFSSSRFNHSICLIQQVQQHVDSVCPDKSATPSNPQSPPSPSNLTGLACSLFSIYILSIFILGGIELHASWRFFCRDARSTD